MDLLKDFFYKTARTFSDFVPGTMHIRRPKVCRSIYNFFVLS